MGLTHAEFFRTLPSALADVPYAVDASQVIITQGTRRVTIELEPQRERRIALLRVPYTPVRFRFEGWQTEDIDAFMERFMSYYRRGGG